MSGYYDKPTKVRVHDPIGGGTWRARESYFHRGGYLDEESGGIHQTAGSYQIWQVKWTGTWTSRLLFEAGFQRNDQSPPVGHLLPDLAAGIAEGNIPTAKFDIVTQTRWGAPSTDVFLQTTHRQTVMTALSYVTGSHAFKFGVESGTGAKRLDNYFEAPGVNFIQRSSNGVPTSVVVYNTPVVQINHMDRDLGIYLQDNWRIKRLTVSPGIRFEHIRVSYPEQGTVPLEDQLLLLLQGYAPRPVFPPQDNVPNWKNWSPRLGVAYDLLGDAKTVVKMSVNRYQAAHTVGLAERYNPSRRQNRDPYLDRRQSKFPVRPCHRRPGSHDERQLRGDDLPPAEPGFAARVQHRVDAGGSA